MIPTVAAGAEESGGGRNGYEVPDPVSGRCGVVRRASAGGLKGNRLDPSSVTVTGDRLRLEQALGNLVDNALRHGAGSIQIRAVPGGDDVELHVIDEGPGFTPAFLPRAFGRFTRADEARTGGGSGLGLAIVAVIARADGGSAHAINRDDGGADV